jgi:hypothetical protein
MHLLFDNLEEGYRLLAVGSWAERGRSHQLEALDSRAAKGKTRRVLRGPISILLHD